MGIDANYFSMRDQYIFITYQDIIKQVYVTLIETLIKDYRDDLRDILILDDLVNHNHENIERLCVERLYKNPLRYIAQSEDKFDECDKLLDIFERDLYSIYTDTPFTVVGAKIFSMLSQRIVKKIYIHTDKQLYQPIYDMEIYFKNFSDKIEYVYGDFKECVESLDKKPTTYILNDVEYAKILLDNDMIEYTEIIIAELGYNFELKDNKVVLKYDLYNKSHDNIFKIGLLPIIDLEEKHYSAIIDLINKNNKV